MFSLLLAYDTGTSFTAFFEFIIMMLFSGTLAFIGEFFSINAPRALELDHGYGLIIFHGMFILFMIGLLFMFYPNAMSTCKFI